MQEGSFSGTPNVVAQTTDGYIWIGTNSGLSRFDGVRFTAWSYPPGAALSDSRIFSLLGTRDGSLWIGTGAGVARWKGGALTTYATPHGRIVAMMEDGRGRIWAARSQIPDGGGPLCRMESSGTRCFGSSEGLPLLEVTHASTDGAGDIWIGGVKGLVRWSTVSDTPDLSRTTHRTQTTLLRTVAGGAGSSAWAVLESSSRTADLIHYAGSGSQRVAPPGTSLRKGEISAVFEDQHGALWIGTSNAGIVRLDHGRIDRFSERDGLSSDAVASFFEDREGNVWVATSKGLDNFRDLPVISYSMREGLPSDAVSTIFANKNTVWIGALNALTSLTNDKLTALRSGAGLPGLNVTTMLQDQSGTLWVGLDHGLLTYRGGAFRAVQHLKQKPLGTVFAIAEDPAAQTIWVRAAASLFRIRHGSIVQEMTSAEIATAYAMAHDPRGGVVLGLVNGDLLHVDEGGVTPHRADPATAHQIRDILVEGDGSLWASTLNEVIWSRGDERRKLDRENGLPCDEIYGMVRDQERTLWLYSRCGLVGIADAELRRWLAEPRSAVTVRLLGALDGVQAGLTSLKPQAVRTDDGRLWFANNTILQMFHPSASRPASGPLPVYIESVVGDRTPYAVATGRVRLAPRTRDVEIDYTGLSFVSPQKVSFRYMLSGVDQDWLSVGPRRQAFYTDLAPGSYLFRVEAAREPGLWDDTGASVVLVVPPTIFQTLTFRLLCVGALLAGVWLAYLARLRRLAREFQERLRERLSERERIARELHDTLLQSLQGVILRFHTATMQVPPGEPARGLLEGALDQADHVVAESRARVADLREGDAVKGDLGSLIQEDGQELADTSAISFLFETEGEARALHPVVQDEVRLIVREALTNAFQHSAADHVRVALKFSSDGLRISVRDDGCGIAPAVLSQGGRPGHWGLSGMRERANKIGARFHLISSAETGTEITLRVSAKLGFRQRIRA